MGNEKYINFILKKYNTDKLTFAGYAKIDAMNVFLKLFIEKGIILKGTFNLMFNFNYKREILTKDLYFFIQDKNIKTFMEELLIR